MGQKTRSCLNKNCQNFRKRTHQDKNPNNHQQKKKKNHGIDKEICMNKLENVEFKTESKAFSKETGFFEEGFLSDHHILEPIVKIENTDEKNYSKWGSPTTNISSGQKRGPGRSKKTEMLVSKNISTDQENPFKSTDNQKSENEIGQDFDKNTCTWCEKKFKIPAHKTMHEMIHTGEKPYSCIFCEKKFAQKGNLKSHQEKAHQSTNNEKSTGDQKSTDIQKSTDDQKSTDAQNNYDRKRKSNDIESIKQKNDSKCENLVIESRIQSETSNMHTDNTGALFPDHLGFFQNILDPKIEQAIVNSREKSDARSESSIMNISSDQKRGRGRPRKNEILTAKDNPVSNIFPNKKRKTDEKSVDS